LKPEEGASVPGRQPLGVEELRRLQQRRVERILEPI
jgi:hypothetical protein